MNRAALLLAVVLFSSGSAIAEDRPKAEYLKAEPPKGSVPYGKIVYVDDGACPKDEIKEITGGNQSRSIPRKVRCVKRPE